jgi:hypothetical protein
MAFIGTPLDTRNTFQSLQGKRFNGDGSTTDFTLDVAPSSTLDIEVFVGNVRQDPNSAYTLSGTTLAFTGAPASGTNNIYVVHQAKSVGTIDPPATETIAKTFSGGVTLSGTTTHSGALNVTGGLDLGDGNITDVGTIAADRVLGDADSDSYIDFPGSDIVTINTGDNIRFRVDASGILSTGGETAPDVSKGGITLNQAQFDANILTFKSSDIAHGMTGEDETDTYATFAKQGATTGGLQIRAFAETKAEEIFEMNCQGAGDLTETKSASAKGAFHLTASIKSGTGTSAVNANGNLLTLSGYTSTEFIFEGNGNFHAESGSTTFDAYEDAQLARAFDLSHGRGVIESKFDKFVSYNHEKLAELKLVGRDEDGKPNSMLNVTGLQRLHNGAIWQQYEKHNQLLEAVYDLAEKAVGKKEADAILEKHEIKRLQ